MGVRRVSEESAVSSQADEFAAIYDKHRGRVYGQCLRRLRSPADADDATQVTFLRAFAAIRRGSGPRRVGPWLATIARNVCSDRLSAPGEAVLLDAEALTLPDDGPAPDDRVLAESENAEVRVALGHLPFAQRSVLHLREVEELPYADIAGRLAVPVTAVETLLFRARANLREEVFAVRAPLKCDEARTLSETVREGGKVTGVERKSLRNHRASCHLCAWLPVRRARGVRAAAVLVVAAAAASARRWVAAPVADAMTAAGAPAKTAAVALTAGSMAAGGLAAEHSRPPDRPPGGSSAAVVHHGKARSASAPRARKAVTVSAASGSRPSSASAAPARARPAAASAAPAQGATRPVAERETATQEDSGSTQGRRAPRVQQDPAPERRQSDTGGADGQNGPPSSGGVPPAQPRQGPPPSGGGSQQQAMTGQSKAPCPRPAAPAAAAEEGGGPGPSA
jgi:RNA polymerase sigma factor (sigma-70 family)